MCLSGFLHLTLSVDWWTLFLNAHTISQCIQLGNHSECCFNSDVSAWRPGHTVRPLDIGALVIRNVTQIMDMSRCIYYRECRKKLGKRGHHTFALDIVGPSEKPPPQSRPTVCALVWETQHPTAS